MAYKKALALDLKDFKERFSVATAVACGTVTSPMAPGMTQGTVTPPVGESNLKDAAVLILVFPGTDGLEVVLTRRSEFLPQHAGQICFPGGAVDDDDENHVQAALREAREEIGLDASAVEVLGTLNHEVSSSGYLVAPVLGVMDSIQPWHPEPGEVEAVFTVPLQWMLDTQRHRLDSITRNGIKKEFYFIDYEDYCVWGLTAAIFRSLAGALTEPPIHAIDQV